MTEISVIHLEEVFVGGKFLIQCTSPEAESIVGIGDSERSAIEDFAMNLAMVVRAPVSIAVDLEMVRVNKIIIH